MSKVKKYRREETSSEDDSEEERRKKDIKERDSFASRLRAKDESKTRNVAMPAPGSGAGKRIFTNIKHLKKSYLSLDIICSRSSKETQNHRDSFQR